MQSSQAETARSIAEMAHRGQVDKAGRPYIEHPAYVAASVDGDAAKAVAWLHDVVEDTPTTLEDLRAAGISDEVVEAVDLLTHREGTPYIDYVRRIRSNETARAVKLADLRHNSDLSRLTEVTEADLRRADRYRKAIAILS